MALFDFDVARRRVKRILNRARIKNLWKSVTPLASYIASLLSIFRLWFYRTGKFQFNPTHWSDRLILILLGLLLFASLRLLITEWIGAHQAIVKRSELYDLISVALSDADTTATIFAGDLSWLGEMLPALTTLKNARPELRLSIYYDRSRIPHEIIELISQLDELGVKLTPYPIGTDPAIRCLLIDNKSSESTRLYIYSRHRPVPPSAGRKNHLFLWQEYGHESKAILSSVRALVNTFEGISHDPIRVGICGVNNVGKTHLATALRDALAKRYAVQLVPDQFRVAHGSRDLRDTYRVVLSQLLVQPEAGIDICIFDRTLLDNYCALLIRSKFDEKIRSISPLVASEMRKLDLILYVKRADGDYSADTTFLTGEERGQIKKALDNFFITYDLPTFEILLDGKMFDESLQRAVQCCIGWVSDAIRRRFLD
jgi:hypothetical protein